jgi:alpha-L-glutamate ligase-like protein
MGINMRNARFLLPNNPRRLYGLVDNKLATKRLAEERGLAVPETYFVVRSPYGAARLGERLAEHDSFVVKPAHGSGGNGVLIIAGRDEDRHVKPSGAFIGRSELRNHISNILGGLFSLGGRKDCALIEYRVRPAPDLMDLSYQGAPDIRVVLFHGYPVMAMLRVATRESDGRANLHRGALGVGIGLASGRTIWSVHHGRPVVRHPDLKRPLIGCWVPGWDRILAIATSCYEMTGLGYLGVDMMIDETRGPLLIEVNARPGLAIQMANGAGLFDRLELIERHHASHPGESPAKRIDFCREKFCGEG